MTIIPKGDRVFECDAHDIPRIKRTLERAGCKHQAATPGDYFIHRWIHFGNEGKSVITVFRSYRNTILGPRVPIFEALVAEEVVAV